MVWSQQGFATLVKLWPFSPILPVLKKYIFFEPTFGKDVKSQKAWKSYLFYFDQMLEKEK